MQQEKEKEEETLKKLVDSNTEITYSDFLQRKSEARVNRVKNKLSREKVLEIIREGSNILIDVS